MSADTESLGTASSAFSAFTEVWRALRRNSFRSNGDQAAAVERARRREATREICTVEGSANWRRIVPLISKLQTSQRTSESRSFQLWEDQILPKIPSAKR
jgi:hypothetical protein